MTETKGFFSTTVRVSPPGQPNYGAGNPSCWPEATQVANPDHLCKLLDKLHEHALVAWDRDVRLRDGDITIATNDHRDGDNILGYAYVDSVVIWRLMRIAADPLGLRWVAFGPEKSAREPDPVTTTIEKPTTATKPPRKRRSKKAKR